MPQKRKWITPSHDEEIAPIPVNRENPDYVDITGELTYKEMYQRIRYEERAMAEGRTVRPYVSGLTEEERKQRNAELAHEARRRYRNAHREEINAKQRKGGKKNECGTQVHTDNE